MDLILASRSQRRRELLALTGLRFTVVATETDEVRRAGEMPTDYVRRLSYDKAQAAASQVVPSTLILAADTIVVDGDDVLGKPSDADQAAEMLRRLRGRTHRVYTAITLLGAGNVYPITEMADSPVQMRAYTDEELADYIVSGDPFDKAGAYAIQNTVFHPVENFAHCFANVMGLPLCHVTRMLRGVGISPPADVPLACQSYLRYVCPVFTQILAGRE